ncbi:hypothetical protein M422DRAFT_249774 [Sphaerobolus stellatus SS14]|uniref:Uncharacterized protein n=1 Tax=Sphaerobolus stellatus (strain SS14) TaxID=990650 RepID=A0A0C9VUK8_SPHS4|nr:hypothetical protein M422DRAFT_249774 [Sphaerobolus stellatus SS14]
MNVRELGSGSTSLETFIITAFGILAISLLILAVSRSSWAHDFQSLLRRKRHPTMDAGLEELAGEKSPPILIKQSDKYSLQSRVFSWSTPSVRILSRHGADNQPDPVQSPPRVSQQEFKDTSLSITRRKDYVASIMPSTPFKVVNRV